MTDHAKRRRDLMARIDNAGYFAFNLEGSDTASLRYLTGFTGEGALLLTGSDELLLTDSRYAEQARQETNGLRIEEGRAWFLKGAAEAFDAAGITRIFFPSSRVAHYWVEEIAKLGDYKLAPERDPLSEFRTVKTTDEIDALKEAAAIADRALANLLPILKIGMNEAEVALELEMLIRRTDAEGLAFEINVSAGENTALNHYNPFHGRRPLKTGDLLLFDFGACVRGYRSDITRTFSVGPATDRAREIYDIVLRANLAAIDATRSGKTGIEVDAVARDLIAETGYGEHFGHGIGHGIGLEVHEAPNLSPLSTFTLKEGMVVTIEPGVYLTGFGGVRIEDDAVITENGCEIITAFPKDQLIEVGI
ncbi:M24 family metallopeptidase [Candidatus Bipolaricaulota bacterium]